MRSFKRVMNVFAEKSSYTDRQTETHTDTDTDRQTDRETDRQTDPSRPVPSSPVQSKPVQSSPVQSSPVQSSPVQSSPVQSSPVQSVCLCLYLCLCAFVTRYLKKRSSCFFETLHYVSGSIMTRRYTEGSIFPLCGAQTPQNSLKLVSPINSY